MMHQNMVIPISTRNQQSTKQSNVKPITAFITTKSDENVIESKMIFNTLVVEHIVPFLLADHFTKAC